MQDLSRISVPLATLLAIWALASRELDPATGAEGLFLGFLAAAVLLAAVALEPSPGFRTSLGAVLITAAIWILPPGADRGAAVTLLLTLVLALALWVRLSDEPVGLPWSTAVPLALGLQFLLRSDHLLRTDLNLANLVVLLALPVGGATAVVYLARRHGRQGALLAGGSVLLLAGEWTLPTALSLMALAAGQWLTEQPRLLGGRLLAVGGLLLLVAWDPRSGALYAAAALMAWGRRIPLALAALVCLVLALLVPVRPWSEALEAVCWVPLLLPTVFLLPLPRVVSVPASEAGDPAISCVAGSSDRHETRAGQGLTDGSTLPGAAILIACGLLTVAAARSMPGAAPLLAPTAYLALNLRLRHPAAALQEVWSALLLAATILHATYPWLRSRPLEAVLALMGIEPTWSSALGLALVTVLAVLVLAGLRRWPLAARCRPGVVGCLIVAVAVSWPLPGETTRLIGAAPVTLDSQQPEWTSAAKLTDVASLVLDSSLANSADLQTGTPVARVRLLGGGDGRVEEWLVRAGYETGEWAARREDISRGPDFTAPPAWLSWVAPEGRFFAQRYRSRWHLSQPMDVERVEIRLQPELNRGCSLSLFRVEVRR